MAPGFDIVVIAVVVIAVIVGVLLTIGSSGLYDRIGEGDLDRDSDVTGAGGGATPVAAVRDEEIRQMMEARNARRIAKGLEPVDVEREVQRLEQDAAPEGDRELREEVRQLVEARNARRVAKGQEPLDVEDEVQRRLRALGGG
jgi:hypothetical protein